MKYICSLLALLCVVSGCSSESNTNSFEKVDRNNDGGIVSEELVLLDPDLPFKTFATLDVDRNGKLDENEYEKYLHPETPPSPPVATTLTPQTPTSAPATSNEHADQGLAPTPSSAPTTAQIEPKQQEVQHEDPSALLTDGDIYTARENDTFWGIAEMFHVRVKDLTTANPEINPKKLRPGMQLHIPSESSETEASKKESLPETSTSEKIHKVGANETLWAIAKQYDMTTKALLEANPDVNPRKLRPGTELRIP